MVWREVEDVYFLAQTLEVLLVADTEALLFVYYQQTRSFENDVFLG